MQGVAACIVDKLRTGAMGSAQDTQPDTGEAGSSRRKWPHLADDLARLAADRDHTTAEEA
jgi:hypothetical protein